MTNIERFRSHNFTLNSSYVVPTWTLVDGIVFLVVICIWMVALCFFLEKWGNFRIPQPRDILRKFRPMNVDRVHVIDNSGSSVIYKTYGKRMSLTMADRRKRIESFREKMETEERENQLDSPESSQALTWRQRASSLFADQKKVFQQFRRNSGLVLPGGSGGGDLKMAHPKPLLTFNDGSLSEHDEDEEAIHLSETICENKLLESDHQSEPDEPQSNEENETEIDVCDQSDSTNQMCTLLTCYGHENERDLRKTSCPSVIITFQPDDS